MLVMVQEDSGLVSQRNYVGETESTRGSMEEKTERVRIISL